MLILDTVFSDTGAAFSGADQFNGSNAPSPRDPNLSVIESAVELSAAATTGATGGLTTEAAALSACFFSFASFAAARAAQAFVGSGRGSSAASAPAASTNLLLVGFAH